MTQSTNDDIKAIQVVYIALMAGLISFLIIAVALTQMSGPFIGGDESFMNTMLIVLIAMTAVTIPTGIVLFKKRMKEVSKMTELGEKIMNYRAALVVRAALFEGAGFFAVVCTLMFGHYIFIVTAVAIFLLFVMFFPTKTRIAKDMQISIEDLK